MGQTPIRPPISQNRKPGSQVVKDLMINILKWRQWSLITWLNKKYGRGDYQSRSILADIHRFHSNILIFNTSQQGEPKLNKTTGEGHLEDKHR